MKATLNSFAQALFFALPFMFAGLFHIVVIKQNFFPALARIPLDFGLTLRGRRLFGHNKTTRGALTMIAAVTTGIYLQSLFVRSSPAGASLSILDYDRISPLLWGLFLGAGCVIGELPNSFAKRQLDIPPGSHPLTVKLRAITWIFDQIDSVIGVLIFASLIITLPLLTLFLLLVIGVLVHPLGSVMMVRLKLKRSVG